MKLAATMQKPDVKLNLPETGPQKETNSLARYKVTVAFAIVVTLITAIVIVVLVYFAFVKPVSMQNDYHIVRIIAKDQQEDKEVDLEYKVNKKQKMAFVTFKDSDGQKVVGYRDLQQGVEAFRMPDEDMCVVSKFISDGDDDDDDDETDNNDDEQTNDTINESQVVSVNSSRKFMVLNETIYPTINRLAIGERISNFCGNLKSVWMLPEEEVYSHIDLLKSNGRKRRTVTIGGVAHAAVPHFSNRGRGRCTYSCYGSRWGRCYRRCY